MARTIAVYPGAVLLDEFEERGITQSALAIHIGVLPKTVNEICRGKRGISAEILGQGATRHKQCAVDGDSGWRGDGRLRNQGGMRWWDLCGRCIGDWKLEIGDCRRRR